MVISRGRWWSMDVHGVRHRERFGVGWEDHFVSCEKRSGNLVRGDLTVEGVPRSPGRGVGARWWHHERVIGRGTFTAVTRPSHGVLVLIWVPLGHSVCFHAAEVLISYAKQGLLSSLVLEFTVRFSDNETTPPLLRHQGAPA
eukprot:1395388-Amorphochlora_amoeboformis.AAC.2